MNNSTQENTARGWGYDLKVKGIGGDALGTLAEMAIMGYAADKVVKHYSKDGKGIVDRAYDKLKPHFDSALEAMGFPRVNKGFSSTNQHHQSNASHNIDNQAFKHIDTPYSNIKPTGEATSIVQQYTS